MKHVSTSTTNRFSGYTRGGALLLALGAAGPTAWGQSFGPRTDYVTGIAPRSVALCDVNGDGRLDIVTANSGANTSGSFTVSVLLNQATGGFGPKMDYSTGDAPYGVALGDVNGDGRPDLVTANYAGASASVLLGMTNGTFGTKTDYPTGASPYGVALGDVNGDGRPDIVTANYNSSATVSVLPARAGGGFGSKTDYGTGRTPYSVQLGDVTGDGNLDIVVANFNVVVLPGTGSGGFGLLATYTTGGPAVNTALGDVNGDGRLDVVAANSLGFSTASVLLGMSGGGLAPKVDYPTGFNPYGIALGDVNGDQRPDLITTDGFSSSGASVMLALAGGGFGSATSYAIGSVSLSVALGDVNGDGRLDIIAANQNTGSVSVLLNTGTYTPLATARPATAAPDVALAPNPAHDAFAVTLPAGFNPTQAELRNALGQVVRRPAVAGPRFTVETAGLAPGVYLLRLSTGAAVVTRRVAIN